MYLSVEEMKILLENVTYLIFKSLNVIDNLKMN